MEIDTQFDFRQIPFIRLLFPFILGIGILYSFPTRFSLLNISITSFLATLIILKFIPFFKKFCPVVEGVLIFIYLCWCGILIFHTANQHAILPSDQALYKAVIFKQPTSMHNIKTIDCMVFSYQLNDRIVHVHEPVRIYCKSDSTNMSCQTGDSLIFQAKIDKFKSRGNPGEFDFAKYMAIEGFYYTVFLSTKDLHIGGKSKRYSIRRIATTVQQTGIRKFETYGIRGGELAVVSALVVGNTERLDKEIKSIYTVSGSMHILAVSGWHIGVLFLFLNLLLGRRDQRFYYKLFRMAVVLLTIWFYAFITGLSPSVIRSAVMFSLFTIGRGFNQESNSFNILAASAFIILVVDPNELFMASFQLSYMAVAGILFFQPRFSKIFVFNNKMVNNIWQLITVSMAAQLATFPFSLYYFHQFPNYFWLTNILLIPLVWIVIVITILFFCSLPLTAVAKFISFFLGFSLKAMNALVSSITSLPFSVIGDIRFEPIHLFICCALVFLIILTTFVGRNKLSIPCAGIAILMILIFEILDYRAKDSKKEIIVYNTDKGIAISLISGHQHIFLTDTVISSNYQEFSLITADFWRNREIGQSVKFIDFSKLESGTIIQGRDIILTQTKDGLIINFHQKIIFLQNRSCGNEIDKFSKNESPRIDYFIVSPCADKYALSVLQKYRSGEIIIPGKISDKNRKRWVNPAIRNKIAIYDIHSSGALHIVF
jgi:competence protein ComEC